MGRVVAIVVAVLVLAGAGTGVWWFTGRDTANAASTSGTTTTVVTASLTTLEKSVGATGTLTPTVQQAVSFAVSGTVTSVPVKVGDTVAVGQTLATVDTLQLNADLLAAKANLASAQAALADLQAANTGTATQAAQIAAASAKVDVAQAAETAAEAAMGDATLLAPVAGLVTSVNLAVGDRVTGTGSSGTGASSAAPGSSSSSSTSSSGQFEIVGTDAYQSSLSVNDTDVALIKPGDQVEMTSDSLTGTVFGVVRTVGPLSTSTGVASYPVVVDVTGDTKSLHDGISVTARIIYERRANVLTIPTVAITKAADGTSTVAKVASDGTTSTVTVTTGETSGTVTEITAGLSEGDQVQVVTYSRASTGTSTSGTNRQGLPGGAGGSFTLPNGQTIQRNPDGSVSVTQGRTSTGTGSRG